MDLKIKAMWYVLPLIACAQSGDLAKQLLQESAAWYAKVYEEEDELKEGTDAAL